jgi:hypothetical protein
MEEKGGSPVPTLVGKNSVPMGFHEAMRKVLEGERITKGEWASKNVYGMLRDGFLMIHKTDNKFYQWIISEGDLLGTDWEVV